MMKISVNDLRFEGFHGVHEDERITGNTFVVDCAVQIGDPPAIIEHLHETVDYEKLFTLIRNEMATPTPLLETLCMKMEKAIHNTFPEVRSVVISIKKLYPPIKGFTGSSAVTWQKVY